MPSMMTSMRRLFCRMALPACAIVVNATCSAAVSMELSGSPAQWTKVEYSIFGLPEAANPFDPDCIRVDASITAPSGKVMVVPAFWYQGYVRGMDGSAEMLTAKGSPEWKLRYTPEELGEYHIALQLSINDGEMATVAESDFTTASLPEEVRPGWVRVATDGRYFETTEGKPLRLIGENVCWAGSRGTRDFDDWFSAMEKSGMNFARLWLDPWDMTFEHTPGTLNRYSQEGAWKLDHVFSLAEANGIYLMLCLDHHGMYQADDKGWGGTNNFWNRSNPYSTDLGGPCANADEFFTSPEAAKFYEKRLRYLIARYGYSTHLHSWQFFNEIDNIYRQKVIVPEHVLEWHKRMAPVLKRMDPYGHLVTTSLTGGSQRDEYWQIPGMDYTMYHSYGDPAPGRRVSLIAARYHKDFKKPFMIGEYGTSAYKLNLDNDPYLRGFRQILWCGVTSGSCGTAMSWWWEDIHSQDLYPVYAALSRIVNEAGWNEGEWTPIPVAWSSTSTALGARIAEAEPFSAVITLNQFRRMLLSGEAAIGSTLAAARASESLQGYIHGNGDPLKKAQQIYVDAAKDASLSIKVDSIAADAVLVVKVDDTVALRRELPWTGGPMDALRPVALAETIPLDEGRHRIEIANEGGADWLHVSELRFSNLAECAPADGAGMGIEVTGIVGRNSAILHVVSPYAVYPANALTVNPPLCENGKVTFSGLPEGDYIVRWYETMTGSLVAEEPLSVSTRATLTVPAFRDQMAAVVLPAQ